MEQGRDESPPSLHQPADAGDEVDILFPAPVALSEEHLHLAATIESSQLDTLLHVDSEKDLHVRSLSPRPVDLICCSLVSAQHAGNCV